MDENTFFRQATLLICSSLDIEIALWRCLKFLRGYLPADEITLNIYEPRAEGLRYLARADMDGGRRLDMLVRLPNSLCQSIESGRRLQDYLIINAPEKDAVGRIIAPVLGLTDSSFIALRLKIEGQRLGVVDLFSTGRGRFTEEDARLLALLREPFTIAMANALKHQEVVKLKEQLASDNRFLSRQLYAASEDEIVGSEQGFRDVMTMVDQVAPLNTPVLLLGETGVGKELVATAIHRRSSRRDHPFVKVNCGAIPETLIDSELFGHEKGAFTGAVSQKRGRFERAHGGSIFLDEIGELPLEAQVRLLRVLQTREIERVGGSAPVPVDIRVIVATHRNLENMVAEGRFREDLWYRINVFPIHLPPLRQRQEDIPALVEYFLERKSRELGLRMPPALGSGVVAQLKAYTWPGNVRELENIIERALIQHRGGLLSVNHLNMQWNANRVVVYPKIEDQPLPLEEITSRHIQDVLRYTNGKIHGPQGAAEILGLNPSTLRNRMKKVGIPFGRRFRRSGGGR